MPAEVGPQVLGHFGFIHLFSILVLVCVPLAVYNIRRVTWPGIGTIWWVSTSAGF